MGETTTLTGIVAGIVAVVTGAFTYLLSRRKENRIDNAAILKRMDRELDRRDHDIRGLKADVLDLYEKVRERDTIIAHLEASVESLTAEKDGLRDALRQTTADLTDARARIRELERELQARLDAAKAHISEPQGTGL